MKLTMEDGSVLEFKDETEVKLGIELGIIQRPKTLAEKAREALDAAKEDVDEFDDNESIIVPPAVEERLPHPALMPKQVELPPVVFVTQGQQLIIELLRHHPLGLETRKIGELLRWTHSMTSSRMSRLMLAEAAFGTPVVEKVPGHRRYKLTEFGRRCRYEIDARPAHRRKEREPERVR